MSLGKTIRMKRLIEPQFGSCIVCTLDHGMTSPTLLQSLTDSMTPALVLVKPPRVVPTSLC